VRTLPVLLPALQQLPVAPFERPAYTWRPLADSGQSALYLGSKQIGNWNVEQHGYFRLTTVDGQDQWQKEALPLGVSPPPDPTGHKVSEAKTTESEPGEEIALAADSQNNYGLDESKITPNVTKLNGKPISKPEAFESLVGFGKEFADEKLPFIVATLANDAARRKFLADWKDHPAYTAFRDKFRLQAYVVGDKQLSDRNGKPLWYSDPGIRLIEPTGHVKVPEISKGHLDPDQLGPRLVAAVRKVDPNFKPPEDGKALPQVATDVDPAYLVFGCVIFVLIGMCGLMAITMFFWPQAEAE
jgi:hypothetical protein